jgi:hypothetical protein
VIKKKKRIPLLIKRGKGGFETKLLDTPTNITVLVTIFLTQNSPPSISHPIDKNEHVRLVME